jgi:hypothetical protein
MNKQIFTLLSIATLLSVSSCTFPTSSQGSSIPSDPSFEGIDTFFAPTTKVMIDLEMTTEVLKQINEFGNDNTKRDFYHQIKVVIEVTPANETTEVFTFPVAGIRMKGNTSRTSFVENDGLIKDFVHFKLDFKSDSNQGYQPNDYFYGMTQLDMKWNRNLDHTQIRQLYGHKMFKSYLPLMPDATLGGVTIIQTNQANLDLKSTYLGLYTLIEPMNRRLMVRSYGDTPESDGNLYKTLYTGTGPADFNRANAVISSGTTHFRTGNKIGIEDNAAGYNPTYDLKTNTLVPNYSDMVNFIGEINSTTNFSDESFKERLEAVIDMETFILMEALAYFYGNPDNIRNWFNNNYVYFLPSTGKAIFIPYDLDRGLGHNGGWDPTLYDEFSSFGPSMTRISPFENALLRNSNNGNQNPLHRFSVMEGGIPTYLNLYRETLETIANSEWLQSTSLGGGQYEGKFYTMHSQYRSIYYPESGNYLYVQPTSPVLRDYFVTFSINQNAQNNITYHQYITSKKQTYLTAIA